MKRLMTILIMIIMVSSFYLSACSSGSPAVTENISTENTRHMPTTINLPAESSENSTAESAASETAESEPAETEPAPEPVPPGAHPLFAKKIPIAVMINNKPVARPQSGLGQAKLIYQMMTEARTTRLLMFTDVDSGVLGPVRSARPAYLDLVTQYKALYTYAGNGNVISDSPVDGLIRRIDALGAAGRLFYRMSHRKAPHNLYIKAESIYNFAGKQAPVNLSNPLPGFSIRNGFELPEGGVKAKRINYQFTHSESFRYNEKTKKYAKYNGDTCLVDEQTRKAVEAGNVFLIYMPHGKMPNGVHNRINWVGSGRALYFTGGMKYEVTWSKASHAAPMYFTLNGDRLVLNPGLTWVVVLDQQANNTVTIS
ncbi:MAG TPA: DUF3048 domain-containing protein [Bacillota bacterium]|nr:DUF3048 domain-containing protein [Bacillota bacterium]